LVLKTCKISIDKNATLSIGNNVVINSIISINENGKIILEDNSRIINYNVEINANSELRLGIHSKLENLGNNIGEVSINNGSIVIGNHSFIGANMFVRFNGNITIGSYTGCSHGTEMVCDEAIKIGDYCMLSYNINIYDTNSHSTNWEERRHALQNMGNETHKPKTKKIIIGNDVWIGKNATILKGVDLADRCIVGIATVVTANKYEVDSTIISDKPKVIKI
jgi:acetyltransferase-like isoleucine patch superfamily enzyme